MPRNAGCTPFENSLAALSRAQSIAVFIAILRLVSMNRSTAASAHPSPAPPQRRKTKSPANRAFCYVSQRLVKG
jgi:hypothetical protein